MLFARECDVECPKNGEIAEMSSLWGAFKSAFAPIYDLASLDWSEEWQRKSYYVDYYVSSHQRKDIPFFHVVGSGDYPEYEGYYQFVPYDKAVNESKSKMLNILTLYIFNVRNT